MIVEIKVPEFAESISEGTLLDWLKKPGDTIRRDEVLIEIETDKVVLEVPSLAEGVLAEVLAQAGDTVTSGQVIARVNTGAVAGSAPAAPATPSAEDAGAGSSGSVPVPAGNEPGAGGSSEGNTVAEGGIQAAPSLEGLSPAVRKMVAETGINPAQVSGSGKDGRVTKGDLLEHQSKPAPAPAAQARVSVPAGVAAPVQGARPLQRVPMTRIRARIAQRLKEVQNTAAILTTFNEVNMAPIMELRKKHQDAFVKKHGVKLGFMSFFVRAATEALRAFPVVNASVDGTDIVYHGYYDVGIAVSSERGLVVPILRDTDTLSLADVEKAIGEFAVKAKNGKLSLEDMSGGTFSITNGGTFGSMMSTPILNAPQSAILGMHNILERVMVENGQMVIRPMMYLALSYDHRIIDGSEAVRFLVTIKTLLEDPTRLLLDL